MSAPRESNPEIAAARQAVGVVLTPVDPNPDSELAAFEVDVDGMGVIGRWAQTAPDKGMVIWTDGTHAVTDCPPEPAAIEAALRPSIPIRVEFDEKLRSGPSGPRTLPGLRRSS